MVLDKDAPAALWPEVLRLMADPAARENLSGNILRLAQRDSDEKIVDRIDRILNLKN